MQRKTANSKFEFDYLNYIMIKKLLPLFFLFCFLKTSLFAQVPANDGCANALFIAMPSDGDTCLNSSNEFSSNDGTPNPCNNTAVPPGGHDVWFTYVATGTLNTITITPAAAGGAQQVSVTVMNGNCGSTYLTCFTSPTVNGAASIPFNSTAGTQIYFSVTSLVLDGAFTVCVNSVAGTVSPGTDCATAMRLCDKTNFTCPLIAAGGTSVQPPCFSTAPANPGWYQFTAGTSGTMEFVATSPSGSFRWALYDITAGCPTGATVPLACNNTPIAAQPFGLSSTVVNCTTNSFCPPANLVAGNTYAMMIDDVTGSLVGFDAVWGGTFEIAPTANFTVDSTFACGSLTANFTNNSVGATTYSWNFGDASGINTSANPPPHLYTAGTYIVTLTDSSNGCKNSRTKEIVVNPKPSSTFTVDDDSICYNSIGLNYSAFTYTGAATFAATYIWDFGPNGAIDFFSPPATWNVIWSASGTQNTLLVVSENGCTSDTTRKTVHVFDPPTSDFAFNLGRDTVCTGDTITATYSGTAGGAALYGWTYGYGDTVSTSSQYVTIVWNTPGSGKDGLSLTVVENGCLSTTTYDSLVIIQTPMAAFVTNLIRACENEVVNTEATQTLGSAGTFTWNFNGGAAVPPSPTGAGPYPVSWTTKGNKIIDVRVSEYGCPSDPVYDTLHVYPVPTDTFTISTKQLCGADSSTIVYNGSGGSSATFNWSFDGGGTNPAGGRGPIRITFPNPGNYLITLDVTDSLCTSPSHADTIYVGTYPTALAGIDTGACSNTQVNIGAVPVAGNTYSWSPTVGIVGATAANPAVLLSNFSLRDSIATYYLTVTEGFCVSKDTVKVTIHPRQLSYFFPPPAQCQNESDVDFSSFYDSIAYSTYQWDFSAAATPSTSSIASPTGIHFTSSGLINVTLTTQSPGCPADVYQDVMQIDASPVVNFIATPDAGCPPLDVLFTDNSPGIGGLSTFIWNFGNGDTSTVAGPLYYTYPFSGIYYPTLTYTSVNNCSTIDTLITGITVYDIPDPAFVASPKITDDLNPNILFSYEVPNCTCFYDFGDGTTGTECIINHTYGDTGVYNVSMIVTTSNGCIDTAYETVQVKTFYTFYIPSAFSPNNDGRNDVFFVKGIGIRDYQIDIFNRRGQMVYQSSDPYEEWNGKFFNTGGIAPEGVYVYVLKTKDVNNKKHAYKGRITLVR